MQAEAGTIAFPIGEECRLRVQAVRQQMTNIGLDAILLFTGPNLYYFTGMPCGRSGSRPFVYLLPRKGEPVLIVHNGRQFEARQFAQVSDIRTYEGLSHLPLDTLLAAMQDCNLLRGRIGVELSGEMVLDLPFADFQSLLDAVPQVDFVDASDLLWKLRMVKSQAEIAQIARACQITSQAYQLTFASVRAGMSEVEVQALMVRRMLELGGGSPWILITSGTGSYDLVSKGAVLYTIQPGDMVWMDVGCSVNGYWSDFSRAGVVGGPSSAQRDAQEVINAITRLGVQMVRPGVPVAEIANVCNEAVNALKLSVTSNISGLASRVGHGLGLVVTELPSLNGEDATVLEPGMIVTIEPGVATSYGTFHVEQNVLVTSEGPRILSNAQGQLWNIQA